MLPVLSRCVFCVFWLMRSRSTRSSKLSLLPIGTNQIRQRRSKKKRFPLKRMLLLIVTLGFVYHQVKGFFRQPQAILVLGGATSREEFAAQFARDRPTLPIWVSSGSNPEYTDWVFSEAGIDPHRLHLDYQAQDTVTNFTTLVDDFKDQGIESVYLITSDYHMQRAQVIAEIVLGSRDIDFRPIPVPSGQSSEPFIKVLRDGARSILWLVTGHTGSSLKNQVMSKPDGSDSIQ
jgi:uncharacterized SAM-binding protein YcdF (DUF218 family)